MAEKQEGGKPSDFFVGVIDLFAILLPGALLTILVKGILKGAGLNDLINQMPKEGVADWALFLVESYVAGHFIFAIGSLLLDELYDVTWSERFHVHKNEELLVSVTEKLIDLLPKNLTDKEEVRVEGGLRAWASSFVRVQSAPAGVEIDRAEADSKFFRSLITLQLLSWPLFICRTTGPWWEGVKPLYLVFYLVLMTFSDAPALQSG